MGSQAVSASKLSLQEKAPDSQVPKLSRTSKLDTLSRYIKFSEKTRLCEGRIRDKSDPLVFDRREQQLDVYRGAEKNTRKTLGKTYSESVNMNGK